MRIVKKYKFYPFALSVRLLVRVSRTGSIRVDRKIMWRSEHSAVNEFGSVKLR